ncbi:MAG: PqqD family protein [Candidatus Omnitrophica bacterium]|nr:PqqD family protein [Candidatus Omnitrophota bacterium]
MFYKINAKISYETIEEETVIINFDSGKYYSLDKAGILVWDSLAQGASAQNIVEDLSKRYEESPANLEAVVVGFIAELEKEGLISSCDATDIRNVDSAHPKIETSMTGQKIPFEAPVVHKYSDMQDLLLLDPIDDVDERGWPNRKPDA